MIFIDHKYVGLISNRLDRFKRKNSTTYNCRCPICGDSKTDRTKTRGYIYEKKGSMLYFCHNCGASMSFGNFLKTIDPEMHKAYAQEKFVEKYSTSNSTPAPDITKIVIPKFLKDSPLKALKKISQLEWNHPAKMYVDKRKIPPNVQYKLFYAPKFKAWVNSFIPGKFDDTMDEARLVLPFLDNEKNFFGAQGRSFSPSGQRYITIITDEAKPKLFGLDAVDFNRKTYILEGPIDSLFIPNAIAMAGADLNLALFPEAQKENMVFVYDNEPRNKDIIKRIQSTIDKGLRVCIWPQSLEHKDINDMIMSGKSASEIKSIIDNNTHKGLSAQLALTSWKKI